MRKSFMLLLLSSLPFACQAWGPDGHATVGAIADANLTPTAKAIVAQLLKDDLDAVGKPSGRTTLASVASWADEIKTTPLGKEAASWHFHESTICDGATLPCVGGACVDEKIAQMLEALMASETGALQKNEALKWVVHLVGDIHQPLHVGGNADRGGNFVKVALAQSESTVLGGLNLHSVWDNQLAQQVLADPDMAPKLKNVPLPAGFVPGNAAQWMAEGKELARSIVYSYSGFACGAPLPVDAVVLSSEYQNAAKAIILNQLMKGGWRLSAVLNEALK